MGLGVKLKRDILKLKGVLGSQSRTSTEHKDTKVLVREMSEPSPGTRAGIEFHNAAIKKRSKTARQKAFSLLLGATILA